MKSLVLAESRIPLKLMLSSADSESYYVRGGLGLTPFFFQFDERRKDPNTTISGPCSSHDLNMGFCGIK